MLCAELVSRGGIVLQQVGSLRQNLGEPIAQQAVRAHRVGRVNLPGNSPEGATYLEGVACGVERPGAPTGFNHDRVPSQPRDEAIAFQKTPAGRGVANAHFAHDEPALDDVSERIAILSGVETVQASGHECDGG